MVLDYMQSNKKLSAFFHFFRYFFLFFFWTRKRELKIGQRAICPNGKNGC